MRRFTIFLGFIFWTLLIHPSLCLGHQDTLVLQPGPLAGKDSEIRDDIPNTPNGSGYDFIANAWTYGGGSVYFIQRSLIRFDLSEIPQGTQIVSAALSLFCNLNTNHYQLQSGENQSLLLRILEDWDEDQVTWNNQPGTTFADAIVIPKSTSQTQNYPDLDVSNNIQYWFENPTENFGWLFRLSVEMQYSCMVFASSDNPKKEWRPTLTVIYESCTAPVADFTYTLLDTIVEFTDQSSNANTWNWDFGDGYSSNLQNPTHAYSEPGNYYCCLTITDPCGNATHCDTVHYCKPPKPHFSYTLNGDVVSFKDSSETANSWFWDFGDGYFSTLQNPNHVYSQHGNYLCCLTITDSCNSAAFCDTVFYCKGPNPQFTYTLVGQLVNFHDTVFAADNLIWDFGDGYYSNLHNPQHIFEQFGTYFVCLTASNNCKLETTCDSVRVKTSGVNDIGFDGIVIRPNPANDKIVISFSPLATEQPVTMTIFNEQGQKLKHMETIISGLKPESAIDISRLSCGLYILKIGMRDETLIRRFIKL